ncbi:MAG: Ig-like domain-containing protein [Muribaculaceae bacterium]|nr:Ig-like domain-containing protein [Muribaculaceae bacterium]
MRRLRCSPQRRKRVPSRPCTGPNRKKLLIIIAACVAVLGGVGAWFYLDGNKSDSADKIDIETIEFRSESINVAPSGTTNATLEIEPADHNETLEWSSSDETVATVDNNGVVTGISKGTATVSVKSDRTGKDASVSVNVTPTDGGNGSGGNGGGGNGGGGNGGLVPTSKLTLNYGVYEGPVKAGKPDGMGGEFKFTRAMTIDLKDGYGNTVEVGPGDKIISTKFSDGRLRQGEIHFTNGTRKYVSGLYQSL